MVSFASYWAAARNHEKTLEELCVDVDNLLAMSGGSRACLELIKMFAHLRILQLCNCDGNIADDLSIWAAKIVNLQVKATELIGLELSSADSVNTKVQVLSLHGTARIGAHYLVHVCPRLKSLQEFRCVLQWPYVQHEGDDFGWSKMAFEKILAMKKCSLEFVFGEQTVDNERDILKAVGYVTTNMEKRELVFGYKAGCWPAPVVDLDYSFVKVEKAKSGVTVSFESVRRTNWAEENLCNLLLSNWRRQLQVREASGLFLQDMGKQEQRRTSRSEK
ncbi:hypothetical protein [Parasitella parasitica]|uniref:F-box domain-containing protein n=1 Tax=Parasitella parasitica TaxID=35722 RepID=A0A0B7N0N1_9FUNG|nr:hypothetical protein [Parasitella parasitica]